ncbi:MAG: hypothetical protein L0Y62_07800 [Nitrospirae bacterium]|nr:hypothetical protein [Nitrospirota bacterium]
MTEKKGKRVAVLVRGGQDEPLRMAIGITIFDDVIDVYVLDCGLQETEKNLLNLEMMKRDGDEYLYEQQGKQGHGIHADKGDSKEAAAI